MYKPFSLFMTAILALSIFTVNKPISPPQAPDEKMPVLSNQPKVCLHLDTTLSMRGYANCGEFESFPQTLQIIDSGWPGTAFTYCRFGSKVISCNNTEFKKTAVSPDYYGSLGETHIETVIDAAKRENLTVIITDLFQNEGDVQSLIDKITVKYLKNNLAVGIVGIKSQFNGTIYDVGQRGYSFYYNGPRPFYLLIMGKHADVVYYYEKLKGNGLPPSEFTIFSPYLAASLPQFATAPVSQINKLAQVKTGLTDKRVRYFRTRSNESSFSVELSFEPAPYMFEFPDTSVQKPEIKSSRVIEKKLRSTSKDAIQVAVTGFSQDPSTKNITITMNFSFYAAELPGKGLYLYDILLLRDPNNYKMPRWIEEWDMNREDMDAQNGATTLNLVRFLRGLWNSNWGNHQPKMVHLYCYFEKC